MVLHFVCLCARVLRVDGGLRQIRNKKPEVKPGATILVTNCDGLQGSERGKTRQIDIKKTPFFLLRTIISSTGPFVPNVVVKLTKLFHNKINQTIVNKVTIIDIHVESQS